ncbi:MAG: hypothetical protein ABI461_17140, partial [Polyangiaceae bacterium]
TSEAGSVDSGTPVPDSATAMPAVLVYAVTKTDLFSLDVVSKTLAHVVSFSACGTNSDDIAIDGTGQFLILEKNDGIYKVDPTTGACTARQVLSENTDSTNKIGARANGTLQIIALNDGNNNIYSIDPSTGTTTEINGTALPDDGDYDFVCSKTGTCWGAFDHSKCSAGASSTCLYSFADDGGVNAVSLGAIGVHPAGLAYANGTLYSFGDNGSITAIALSGTPTASTFSLTLAGGTTQPGQWFGAASAP